MKKNNIIVIDTKLEAEHFEALKKFRKENESQIGLFVLNNLTGGDFGILKEMSSFLLNDLTPFGFLVFGKIGIAGITLLLSTNVVTRIASTSTTFSFDIKAYLKEFVNPGERLDFQHHMNYLINNKLYMDDKELKKIIGKYSIINYDLAYISGLIDGNFMFDKDFKTVISDDETFDACLKHVSNYFDRMERFGKKNKGATFRIPK